MESSSVSTCATGSTSFSTQEITLGNFVPVTRLMMQDVSEIYVPWTSVGCWGDQCSVGLESSARERDRLHGGLLTAIKLWCDFEGSTCLAPVKLEPMTSLLPTQVLTLLLLHLAVSVDGLCIPVHIVNQWKALTMAVAPIWTSPMPLCHTLPWAGSIINVTN